MGEEQTEITASVSVCRQSHSRIEHQQSLTLSHCLTMVSINGSSPRHGRKRAPLATRISIKALGSCFFCCLIAWVVLGLSLLHESPKRNSLTSASRLGAVEVHDSALRGGQEINIESNNEFHVNVLDTSPSSAIAYAASVTGCGSDSSLVDGAAILKHSIHLSSVHGNGRYDYKMYAIVTPEAMSCAAPLEDIGYTIIQRDTPVAVDEIQGDFLRSRIQSNGCCGEKELIKFEAYTLIQHPLVVHLDLDVLVLKPLDNLFDLMLGKGSDKSDIMWKDQPLPERIDAAFTRDYNMVPASRKYKPVQGGFLVLRPSMETYKEIVEIIRKGDFVEGKGWGSVMGLFYGSMTFQGLIPYFYDVVKPGYAVELNRCIYNNMCDNPRDKRTVNDVVDGNCRDGRDDCEDCRSQPIEDIVTTHYTLCQKPWLCLPHNQDQIQHRLCRKLHQEWFRIRSSLEESWGRSGFGPGQYQRDQFYGFCEKHSEKGYVRIDHPKL